MCRIESEFYIRDLDLNDLEVLYEIDQKCFNSEIAFDRAFFKHLLTRSYITGFMLEIKNDAVKADEVKADEVSRGPAGFIMAGRNSDLAEIITIDILMPFRRRGFGKILMEKMEQNLISCEVKQVFLHVSVNNQPAINLYQKLGYYILQKEKNYYQNNGDAYKMFKPI